VPLEGVQRPRTGLRLAGASRRTGGLVHRVYESRDPDPVGIRGGTSYVENGQSDVRVEIADYENMAEA
jgi:hypothetical protein